MRITNAHKDKIVNALTQDVEKIYKEQILTLRQKAYDKAKGDIPPEIMKAYEEHRDFFCSVQRVRAPGTFQDVYFPEGLSLPSPVRHPDVPAIAGDIQHLKDDYVKIRGQVRAALAPFTTFKKLKDGWPEAAEVLPDPSKEITALVDLDHVNKIREMLKRGAID